MMFDMGVRLHAPPLKDFGPFSSQDVPVLEDDPVRIRGVGPHVGLVHAACPLLVGSIPVIPAVPEDMPDTGDIYNHESLVSAMKQVDVVISTVGLEQLADQVKIIAAINEAGNLKVFLPSEFATDGERTHAVEPALSMYGVKTKIRRAIEAEGIPYTYVVSNGFAGHFLSNLGQINAASPPRDKLFILGDGNAKIIFVTEEDIATYTIRAVDDPRTLNKILYMRPPANILSFNEIVSLWEKKIRKSIEKVHVPEEQLLKNIEDSPMPLSIELSVGHSAFVKGDTTNYEIEPAIGVEATELYPDVEYTTIDKFLDQFV